MTDPFNLQRFLAAQAPIYHEVLTELQAGRKQTHWMWFVFPQIQGLGASATSQRFAVSSRQEAVAFLEHQILGTRLRECTALVNAANVQSAYQIFGSPDYMKFHSSMTLFAAVANDAAIFEQALAKYFGGAPDPATLAKL